MARAEFFSQMICQGRAHNLNRGSIERELSGFASHAVSAKKFLHRYVVGMKNERELTGAGAVSGPSQGFLMR